MADEADKFSDTNWVALNKPMDWDPWTGTWSATNWSDPVSGIKSFANEYLKAEEQYVGYVEGYSYSAQFLEIPCPIPNCQMHVHEAPTPKEQYSHLDPEYYQQFLPKPSPPVVRELASVIPALLDLVTCPACGERSHTMRISDVIMHLNDHYKWSREQIADWLDTLDADLSFPTPETTTGENE